MEGRGLALGHLVDLAEHLAGAGLVEADLRIHDADGVQDPGHPQRRGLTREHGLGERSLHERLRRQVVDLVGPVLAQDADHRHLVQQVAGHERHPVLDAGDPLEVQRAAAAQHPDDLVAMVEQQLRQVGTILTGDAGDEGALGHGQVLPAVGPAVC